MSSSSFKEPYYSERTEKQPDLQSTDLYWSTDSHQPVAESTEYTSLSWVDKWAGKLSAETKGVEPITDEEKDDTSIFNAASMWFSANMVIAAYSMGCLGTAVFGLNFWESVLTIVFFSFLGLLPVAFFSVFGAEFGLRQMILSRFLLGNVTARIFCVINVIACVGWGSVNTIASASLLHMVNQDGARCPPWAGCLIIVVSTVIVTFFGYKVIHAYERWSWVPNFFVFLVIIARLKISGNFTVGEWTRGTAAASGVLSFGGVVFGFASGWTTYAADYTVYMPRETNKWRIFFALVFGLSFPLCFAAILGAASITGTVSNANWSQYYNNYSVGGLIYVILVPDSLHGFGEFCCVVLAMSTVANNIPSMYSIALGTQAAWNPLARVPRVFWTLLGNAITLAISIPAYYNFETFMSSFMDAIAYYLGIYISISLSEHFFYRKSFRSYNVEDWNNWSRLPVGYAGCASLVSGALGVAFGMSQSYWVGQIARHIGGGDIGFELGFGFSFVTYNILRPLEIKYTGR